MKIINIELQKLLGYKSIYIGLLLSILTGAAMTYASYVAPHSFQFRHTQAFYSAYFIQIVLIYILVESVLSEHKSSTLKLIVNKYMTINKIFINKLIAMLCLGVVFSFVNIIFNIIVYNILTPDLNIYMFALQRLIIYTAYIFCIFGFSLLIYSFEKSSMVNLMIVIFSFYLSYSFILILVERFKIDHNILDFIPFYGLTPGMQGFYFNINMIIGAVILGIVTLVLGLRKLSKQDIL